MTGLAEPTLGTVQVRAGVGWQYALADLSLILFLVTAAALARQPVAPPPAAPPAEKPEAVALADPVAVWRAGPGAPSLDEWLAGQAIDPRQRLTIVARYADGRAQEAFARAEGVIRKVRKLPPSTRTVVEPAGADDLSATLTWDGADPALARPLQ
jgi:hypothetical protein